MMFYAVLNVGQFNCLLDSAVQPLPPLLLLLLYIFPPVTKSRLAALFWAVVAATWGDLRQKRTNCRVGQFNCFPEFTCQLGSG